MHELRCRLKFITTFKYVCVKLIRLTKKSFLSPNCEHNLNVFGTSCGPHMKIRRSAAYTSLAYAFNWILGSMYCLRCAQGGGRGGEYLRLLCSSKCSDSTVWCSTRTSV